MSVIYSTSMVQTRSNWSRGTRGDLEWTTSVLFYILLSSALVGKYSACNVSKQTLERVFCILCSVVFFIQDTV